VGCFGICWEQWEKRKKLDSMVCINKGSKMKKRNTYGFTHVSPEINSALKITQTMRNSIKFFLISFFLILFAGLINTGSVSAQTTINSKIIASACLGRSLWI
jgi:hypothetical protein